MDQHTHQCPACGRAFESILDYPLVKILSFAQLPIPEAVDHLSAAAAERALARRRRSSLDPLAWRDEGINQTPQIARACQTPEVLEYLARLAALPGQKVTPRQLLPTFRASGYFKGAYPVGDTGIYLCLADGTDSPEGERTAEVGVYCDGPNLGSAGGATLQHLGAIARLHYQGLLNRDVG